MLIGKQLRALGLVAAFAVATVALPGCSAKNAIGKAAQVATTAATRTVANLNAALLMPECGPAIKPYLLDSIRDQEQIIAAAAGIQHKLPNVEDKASWFENLLAWWPVIPVVLVFLALAYLGLLPLAVRFVGGLVLMLPRVFGWLIPPRIRSEAKLDFEAHNGGGHRMLEQSIAAKRASRPAYDAVYRTLKKGVAP